MASLKAVGSALLVLAGAIGFSVLVAAIIFGATYVAATIVPYLSIATTYALPICGIILLPLTSFRSTRVFAVYAMFACSYLFGAFLWCVGFLVTLNYWGYVGAFVGLFIAGVGVVPIAMLAAALHADSGMVGNLLIGVAVVFGSRTYAMYVARKIDSEEQHLPRVLVDPPGPYSPSHELRNYLMETEDYADLPEVRAARQEVQVYLRRAIALGK